MQGSNPDEGRKETIVGILREHCLERGDKVVFSFLSGDLAPRNTLTFADLYERSGNVARCLLNDYRKGDRALLLFDNGIEFAIAFYACLSAGIIAVPAFAPRKNQKLDRLERLVNDSGARVILTSSEVASRTEPVMAGIPAFDNISIAKVDQLRVDAGTSALPAVGPGDIAFLQYSSGTTGAAKGVVISHDNIVENQKRISLAFSTTPAMVVVSWLPFFHDMGLGAGLLHPVFVGGTAYLMSPTHFLQSPVRWLKAISHYSADVSGGPDFAWQLCVDRITEKEMQGLDLSTWQVGFNGAEPIKNQTMRRFEDRFRQVGFSRSSFFPCYGMAEATLFVSGVGRGCGAHSIEVDERGLSENRIIDPESRGTCRSLVSSGRVWLNDEIKVVDPSAFTALPDGHVGEVWFRSESVARRYWSNPELSKQVFDAVLKGEPDKTWLRTGDLGFVARGHVFVTGRLKDLIIIRGRNYYPQDIERAATASAPYFIEAGSASFSVPANHTEGVVLVQEVERTQLRKIDPGEAIKRILDEIADKLNLSVHDVVLVKPASLSRTSSGKIQRSLNRRRYLNGDFDAISSLRRRQAEENKVSAESPPAHDACDDVQELLVSQLSETLGRPMDEIDRDDNFLSLGLDSVSAVEFIKGVSTRTGKELPATVVYDYPTVRKLSHFLGQAHDGTHKPLSRKHSGGDIAIVGMACRFPGAGNLHEFWNNLCGGRCEINIYPQSRAYGADVDSEFYRGGYLDDIEHFDNDYFSISTKEARFVDPQHRLALELSDEAMRHAGYHPAELAGSNVGVYIGIGQNDYMLMGSASDDPDNPYLATGCSLSMAANRISYFYDLCGPSMAIDTACSASLVALHQAVTGLRAGDCEAALAGGVKLIMLSQTNTILKRAQMLSPDGICRTFDDSANGYVRGEGAGMLLLKPIEAAESSGDPILGVIKGSATNQDGRSNGITAPNGVAQQRVVAKALADARVAPSAVGFVEAHGTATSLGDPIEVNALSRVYGSNRASEFPLLVGSVKANIGHLEQAAGVAGVIKAVLSLAHNAFPPQAGIDTLNQHVDWERVCVRVPQDKSPIEGSKGAPIYGAVSSFGFGGSNAHMVLQQYDLAEAAESGPGEPSAAELLVLSAKTSAGLLALRKNYAQHLLSLQGFALRDVCARLNEVQDNASHRTYILANTAAEMSQRLAEDELPVTKAGSPRVCFMFTGQGSQYKGMARELYEHNKAFKESIHLCAELFDQYLDNSLLAVIYGDEDSGSLLDQTVYTQPSLFAVEYSLAVMWKSAGVAPDLVLGHSIGEFAAACIAGVMSLEDAVKLVAARARLIQEAPGPGAMLAVKASEGRIGPLLAEFAGAVDIAAINDDEQIVLSGKADQIDQIAERLGKAGISAFPLKVSHGFHSPLMDPVLSQYRETVESVRLEPPMVEFVSCLTGKKETDMLATADYWVDHVRNPVLFRDALRFAYDQGANCFIEVGPLSALSKMTKRAIKDETALVESSIDKDIDSLQCFLQTLGRLFCSGVDVSWSSLAPKKATARIPLPPYGYAKKRLWLALPSDAGVPKSDGAIVPDSGSVATHLYQIDWCSSAPLPLLNSEGQSAVWLIIARNVAEPENSALEKLYAAIQESGARPVLAEASSQTGRIGPERYSVNCTSPQGYLDLLDVLVEDGMSPGLIIWSVGLGAFGRKAPAQEPNLSSSLEAAEILLQTLETQQASRHERPGVCFLTSKTAEFNSSNNGGLLCSAEAWGVRQLAASVFPALEVKCIDLPADDIDVSIAQSVVAELSSKDGDRFVTYTADARAVPALTPLEATTSPQEKFSFKQDARYILSSNESRMVYTVARWMVERGARSIEVLLWESGRGPEDLAEHLSELRADIRINEVGLTSPKHHLSDMLDLENDSSPLSGVIHISGGGGAATCSPEQTVGCEFSRTAGTAALNDCNQIWWLHCLTRSRRLEQFVLLSAGAAFSGNGPAPRENIVNDFAESFLQWRRSAGLSCSLLQISGNNFDQESGSGAVSSSSEGGAGDPDKAIDSRLGEPERAPTSVLIPRWFLDNSVSATSSHSESIDGITIIASDKQGLGPRLLDSISGRGELHPVAAVIEGRVSVRGAVWFVNPCLMELFKVVKALIENGAIHAISELRVFTFNAFRVHEERAELDAAHGTWGFLQSLSREYTHLSVCQVDLDHEEVTQTTASGIAFRVSDLTNYCSSGRRTLVAYRKRHFYCRRLLSAELAVDEEAPIGVKKQGVYVVIGGATGVGLAFVKYLRSRFDARVAIIGRRSLDQLDRVSRELDGFGTKVLYFRCAVENTDSLRDKLKCVTEKLGEINGVVHSAMVHDVKAIEKMTPESLERVLSPKCKGIRSLADVTRGLTLDFLMVFSSVQSFIGYPLSANYSAASTYLDGYARALGRTTDYPVRVVNWGYWGDVGAAANTTLRQLMQQKGQFGLTAEGAFSALLENISLNSDQVIIARITEEVLREMGWTNDYRLLQYGFPATDRARVSRAPVRLEEADLWRERITDLESGMSEITEAARKVVAGILIELGLKEKTDLLESMEQRRIVAGYAPLIEVLLDDLSCLLASDISMDLESFNEIAMEVKSRHPELTNFLPLLQACLSDYKAILKGEKFALDTIFPDGSNELAGNVYDSSIFSKYYNHVLAKAVLDLAMRQSTVEKRPLRILEIGAGTGASCKTIVAELEAHKIAFEYCYTDLWDKFLDEARARYASTGVAMEFRVLDIGSDPEAQGFSDTYDAVVATNVIHATSDLPKTLLNIKRLLAPNGTIFINESVEVQEFSTFSFSLIPSWWNFKETTYRIKGSPLVDLNTWKALLSDVGFQRIYNRVPDEPVYSPQAVLEAITDNVIWEPLPNRSESEIALDSLQAHQRVEDAETYSQALTPLNAVEALGAVLESRSSNVALVLAPRRHWKSIFRQPENSSWLFELSASLEHREGDSQRLKDELQELVRLGSSDEAGQREEVITRYLQKLAALISESEDGSIPDDVPIVSLGLDSLLVVELKYKIEQDFGLALSIVEIFKSESLRRLAYTLARRLEEPAASAQANAGQEETDTQFEEGLL